MRPEAELLISCARVRVDAEEAKRIRTLLREDLDWAYIFRRAQYSGVIPLLYSHLKATNLGAVPGVILDRLRDQFYRITGYNLLVTRELLDLLKLFEVHGIRAIPFKGPVLAAAVYGNLGLRQFVDLDLLINAHDMPRAKELLVSRGYRPKPNLAFAREQAFIRCDYAQSFLREQDGVMVETHWRIAERFYASPRDPHRLWERSVPVPLAGKVVWTFSSEDLLLILCTHGAKHLWDRLIWICDVAELVRASAGMDWGWVLKEAGKLHSTRILSLGLFLAHDLLGAPLPEEILQRLGGDPAIRPLASQVRECLFADRAEPPGLGEISLFFLRARDRLRDRVRHCLDLVMTPSLEDWESVPLPASLSFLYYLLRPFRLARKYGAGVLRCRA